jgi:hypothetical protein
MPNSAALLRMHSICITFGTSHPLGQPAANELFDNFTSNPQLTFVEAPSAAKSLQCPLTLVNPEAQPHEFGATSLPLLFVTVAVTVLRVEDTQPVTRCRDAA